MGWGDVISIGLGLGNAAINASNASTLQQMKMQQASDALVQEFLNALRTGMFNLNQTAAEVLRSEAAAPLKAAGAMRILDYQLSSSGVTPDLFTDLADKKFAADTARLVSDNSRRMYAALDENGQTQVDQVVDFVRRLPDYRYYLENADTPSRLQEAKSVVNAGGGLNGCAAVILVLAALLLLPVLAVAVVPSEIVGYLAMIVGVPAAIYVAVKGNRKHKVFIAAKKTIQELESTLDLERFEMLQSDFTTPDKARETQQRAEEFIERFFGDYTLLQDGWRA